MYRILNGTHTKEDFGRIMCLLKNSLKNLNMCRFSRKFIRLGFQVIFKVLQFSPRKLQTSPY
jgi:hypothetical protein